MSEAPGPSWKAIMPAMQDKELQTEVLCYPHYPTKLNPSTVWRSQQCQTLISIGPFESNVNIYPLLINIDTEEIEKECIDFIPLSKKVRVRFSEISIQAIADLARPSITPVSPILKTRRLSTRELKFIS